MLRKFFLTLLTTGFLSISVSALPVPAPQTDEVAPGVLDLRGRDLHHEQVLLDGQWEFCWSRLLGPLDDFPAQKDYLPFPETWNDLATSNGIALSNFGYGTYRVKILLPEDRPMPGIYIKHVYCSYMMYINGELVSQAGTVGTDEQSSSPKWVPEVIMVPPGEDTLDVILQIANFQHRKGGIRESLVISGKKNLETKVNTILAFDLLLAGTLIMAGLFFYGLFVFGQHERSALYFALFCLTFSYRVIGADDYSLQVLFPEMNWLLSIKLEYLSLFVSPIFFALYTHTLFPFRYWLNPLHLFVGISVLFAMIVLLFPPSVFTVLVEPYLLTLLFGVCVAAFVYIKAWRRKLNGARYAVISSALVLSVFLYKIFNYYGALQEIELITFLGYLSFFFFQSLILFFLFTSSLRKAKEEAERASKAKSEFLSMMSHEIRTPMNAVIGLTNYLLEDEPKKNQLETLNTLKFSAQNLLVIINDILDFSKIEANKIELSPEAVKVRDLVASLRQAFEPLAENKNLSLEFDVDQRIPPFIICDPTRTSQILTNLISNAIKFTHEGKVTVQLQLKERLPDAVRVLVSVSDTGIGIPKDKHEAIFQSFTQASTSTTRQFGGTGLGLSITKKLLELMGSDLHLKSDEGHGSTFYFSQTFKIGEGVMTEPEGKGDVENARVEHDILLVEDNEVNVMVATKFLEKWGARVTLANNGQEAVQLLMSRTFKVILMDLQMPVIDGYEAVREIRRRGIHTPVIALTASALLERQKKIFEAGMDDYVTKPFDPVELLRKILHFVH